MHGNRTSKAPQTHGCKYLGSEYIHAAEMLVLYHSSDLAHLFCLYRAAGLTTQEGQGLNDFDDPALASKSFLTNKVVDPLHTFNEAGKPLLSEITNPYFVPRWQTFPVLETSMVNENLLENSKMSTVVIASMETRSAVLSGFHFAPAGNPTDPNATTAFFATLESINAGEQVEYIADPMSHMAFPIFDSLNGTNQGEVVGVLLATIHWQQYLRDVLHETENGYQVVIENGCDPFGHNEFTYNIDGPVVQQVERGDRHDRYFSHYLVDRSLSSKGKIKDGTPEGIHYGEDSCPYMFHIYPTRANYDKFVTSLPVSLCLSVALVFGITIGLFLCYCTLVERRQRILLAKATQSTAIVSSLFVSTTNRVPVLCNGVYLPKL